MRSIREGCLADPAIITLSAALLLAPSVFGFLAFDAATLSCIGAALVVFLLAMSATVENQGSRGWTLIGIGLILAAAPWLLSFSSVTAAMWTHVSIGLGIAAVVGIDLLIRKSWFGPVRE